MNTRKKHILHEWNDTVMICRRSAGCLALAYPTQQEINLHLPKPGGGLVWDWINWQGHKWKLWQGKNDSLTIAESLHTECTTIASSKTRNVGVWTNVRFIRIERGMWRNITLGNSMEIVKGYSWRRGRLLIFSLKQIYWNKEIYLTLRQIFQSLQYLCKQIRLYV